MKAGLNLFLVVFVFSAATANAMPPTQHLAKGTVTLIDQEGIVLALENHGKDTPTHFAIKEGRTRFRMDRKSAGAERLVVGQAVRLYCKKERGDWIATEISWKTPPPSKASIERRP